MKDFVTQTVDLEQDKIAFLEKMVSTYDLGDVGKAIRCLINHAREHPDLQETIFSEVRCLDC